MLIHVIHGEKSLSLHITKLKTTKITLYNGKEIQKNHRHIGTAVCERSCPHRSPGGCIRAGRYLCTLSASERKKMYYSSEVRTNTECLSPSVPKKEGITPQDVVDRYHSLIKESFKEFGISFDVYSRTTSPTHHQLASDFFKTLYNKGEFIEKTSEQYYDEEAKTFLADRYITGECPHCHSEGAYGDQCEKCGTSLSPTDLINPKSAISGSKPVMKETKHWYLPLDKHEAGCANGFWKITKNGVRTCTVNAKAGSTWVCNHAP